MALQQEYYSRTNSWGVRGAILPPTQALTDGEWHDLEGFFPLSVCVEGSFDGSALVCVSNFPTRPDNSWHGAPLGTFIGSDGGTRTVDIPYRWVKVRVLSYVSGEVHAYAFGLRIGQHPGNG